MRNYQCGHCEVIIENQEKPNSGQGCRESQQNGYGGQHFWIDLGEVGYRNYQCQCCGVIVRSANTPGHFGYCKQSRAENYGGHHIWVEL